MGRRKKLPSWKYGVVSRALRKISKDNSRFTRLEEWRNRRRNSTLVKTHYNGIILFPVNSSRISRDITKFKTTFHTYVHTGNTCSKYERIICSPEAREVHFHEMVNHSRRSKWPRMFRHPYSLSDDIPFSLAETLPWKFCIAAPRFYFTADSSFSISKLPKGGGRRGGGWRGKNREKLRSRPL